MPKTHVTIRLDTDLLEAIEARRVLPRSAYIERACRAFLAHDEGSAVELARIVRRYRLASQQDWADLERLEADAARVLARFEASARS